jgi:hypothetical protein
MGNRGVKIMRDKILYRTPFMRIGKHLWRVVVRESEYYGAVTEAQFVKITPVGAGYFNAFDDSFWSPERKWHGWNGNASDCGLPKTLHKIHFNHALNIDRALLVGMESLLSEWDNAGKTGLLVDNLRHEIKCFKMSSRFGRNSA